MFRIALGAIGACSATLVGLGCTQMPEATSASQSDITACKGDSAEVEVVSVEKRARTTEDFAAEGHDPRPYPPYPPPAIDHSYTVMHIAAQEELNEEWLEHLVQCRLTAFRHGEHSPDMQDNPLAVPGVEATVGEGQGGYTIELSTEDPEAADEVYERARALLESPDRRWFIGWPEAGTTAYRGAGSGAQGSF